MELVSTIVFHRRDKKKSRLSIHAHRAILAAGSGRFLSELRLKNALFVGYLTGFQHAHWSIFLYLLTSSKEEKPSKLQMRFGGKPMQTAVLHLYGFDFMDNDITGTPASLNDFINVCLVAAYYEIADLLDMALKAASHALAKCLSNESDEKDQDALKEFLSSDNWDWSFTDDDHAPHVLKIFGENLVQLYTKPVFQTVLDDEPKLARLLLGEMVKEKALREMPGGMQ